MKQFRTARQFLTVGLVVTAAVVLTWHWGHQRFETQAPNSSASSFRAGRPSSIVCAFSVMDAFLSTLPDTSTRPGHVGFHPTPTLRP